MNKKLLCLLMFVFSLGLTFTACSSDDDDPVNLSLEKSEVNVDQGATVTVKITQGNGDYKVNSASETTATASVSGDVITVSGVAAGETTITVTDKDKKTATLKVTVVGYAEQIAATYEGDLTLVNFMGQDIVLSNEIVLSKGDDNNAKLSIETLTIPMGPDASIGVTGIAVNSVPVTKSGDTYTLTETQETINIKIIGSDDLIPAKVTVNGTVTTAGKIDLTINVTDVVTLPTDLAITFDGQKKAN